MHRIVIDAMGGDYAPEEILKGAVSAAEKNDAVFCVFVGDKQIINSMLTGMKIAEDRYEIVHASQIIGMEDKPKAAIAEKSDASVLVAANLVKDGKGDALVSAGSTGATVMASAKILPKMAGVERGVLASVFPANKNKAEDPGLSIMLDIGATLHCTATQLVSFAIMGIEYARLVLNMENPRVGLLNIGEEETKGYENLVEANQLMKDSPQINFIGNVEGKDIMSGIADIIVTEGFTGNIALKSIEGLAEHAVKTGKQVWNKNLLSKLGLTMLSPVLKKLKRRLDYSEYGGAPILGFSNLVVKAHGRSKAKAIMNAVLLAAQSVETGLVNHMEVAMKDYYMSMFDKDKDKK